MQLFMVQPGLLAAVIYHAGTDTMAAIARAGIPQAAFPFMGDQFENLSLQFHRAILQPEKLC